MGSKQKVAKKKKGVGVDFKRVKRKVGKKLPRAENATRTDFKAKALILPEQSVGADKGEAVSGRNLTLKDLLAQAGHYSARTRRDSLVGLRDLLQRHPELLQLHTATILETLAPRVADAERAVRDGLLTLLRSNLLPGLPQERLAPFFPLLAAHICSGMTHLAADVRAAALPFVDLLTHFYPDLLRSSAFAPEVLGNYIELLSRGGSPSGRTSAKLLDVLSSLHRFLKALFPKPSQAVHHKRATQKKQEHVWACKIPAVLGALHGYLSEPAPAGVQPADTKPASADSAKKVTLATTSECLVPLLLSAWLECTPSTLSDSPEPATLQALLEVARLLHLVLAHGQGGEGWNESPGDTGGSSVHLPALLQKMMPYFPVAAPPARTPVKVVDDLVSLNVALCELMLPFLGASGGSLDEGSEAGWETAVLNYLEGLLGGILLPASGLSEAVARRQLPDVHCPVVLAGLRTALPAVREPRRNSLLEAFTRFFEQCGAASEGKVAGLGLMVALLQDPASQSLLPPVLVARWLQSLPRLLWELRLKQPTTSHQVLLLLHRTAQSLPPEANQLAALQPSLLPFFCTLMPSKKEHGEKRTVFGPFIKLPLRTQILVLDLLPSLGPLSLALVSALVSCSLAEGVPVQTAVRVVEVLQHCVTMAGTLSIGDFLSALLSLLFGLASTPSADSHSGERSKPAVEVQTGTSGQVVAIDGVLNDNGIRRQSAVGAGTSGRVHGGMNDVEGFARGWPRAATEPLLRAVCASLLHVGEGPVVLELVAPMLMSKLGSDSRLGSVQGQYAALRVIAACQRGRRVGKGSQSHLPAAVDQGLPPLVASFLREVVQLSAGKQDLKEEGKALFKPALFLLETVPQLLGGVVTELKEWPASTGQSDARLPIFRHLVVLQALHKLASEERLQRAFLDIEEQMREVFRYLEVQISSMAGGGPQWTLCTQQLVTFQSVLSCLFGWQ